MWRLNSSREASNCNLPAGNIGTPVRNGHRGRYVLSHPCLPRAASRRRGRSKRSSKRLDDRKHPRAAELLCTVTIACTIALTSQSLSLCRPAS
jgi:hypothetical protein